VKPIKMLGLAALAALMAMALVGAGSAMAESTGLCASDGEECEAVTHVHKTTSSKATLLGALEFKCDVLYLGDVKSTGSPLAISGNFTYTNCVRENGKACEVTETSSSASISILKTAHELGQETYSYEVNIHCGILLNCTYDGEGLSGHVLGPLLSEKANGEVRLEKQVTHRVKGVCSETAELDILTSPLSATYIGEEELQYMVCIFVGNQSGRFKAAANSTECKEEVGTEKGEYELGTASTNVKGSEVCALVGKGLYLTRIWFFGWTCTTNDGTPRVGQYEEGTVA